MEGHSTQVPVHVTVLMATVGVPVEVSCKVDHHHGVTQPTLSISANARPEGVVLK